MPLEPPASPTPACNPLTLQFSPSRGLPGGAAGVEALATAMDLSHYLCMQHADLASLQDPKQPPVVVDESLISGAVKRRGNGQRASRACPSCACPSCSWASCTGGGGSGGKSSAWWEQAVSVAAGEQGQPAAEQLAEAAAAADRQRRWLPWSSGAACCGPGPSSV